MLRKALSIAFSQFLLVAVLVSMMGVPMQKMECLLSGKTRVAFIDLDGCCAQPGTTDGEALSANCCLFSSELFQIDASATEQSVVPAADVYAMAASIPGEVTVEAPLVPVRTEFFADLPPPIPGTEQCVLHQVFRI